MVAAHGFDSWLLAAVGTASEIERGSGFSSAKSQHPRASPTSCNPGVELIGSAAADDSKESTLDQRLDKGASRADILVALGLGSATSAQDPQAARREA